MNEQQLTLGFELRDDATFASFMASGNQEAFTTILNFAQGKTDKFVYIWGPTGSGRTHLLQACCHAVSQLNQSAVYFTLRDLQSLTIDLFVGLENLDLICLDDIEHIAGNAAWEEQLFHLFNRLRANNKRLLIASSMPPAQLAIKLADLKSRLTWGIIYQLHALDDEQKLIALQLRAQGRGIDLEDAVGRYLLRRCARNMAELFTTLEELDRASLVNQRRITIPFVKEVLGF